MIILQEVFSFCLRYQNLHFHLPFYEPQFIVCCCFASVFSNRKTTLCQQLAIPEGMQPSQKSYSSLEISSFTSADKRFNPSHKFANRKEEQRESSDRPLGFKRIDSVMCHSPAVSGHFKLQGFIFNAYVLSSLVRRFNFSSV